MYISCTLDWFGSHIYLYTPLLDLAINRPAPNQMIRRHAKNNNANTVNGNNARKKEKERTSLEKVIQGDSRRTVVRIVSKGITHEMVKEADISPFHTVSCTTWRLSHCRQ